MSSSTIEIVAPYGMMGLEDNYLLEVLMRAIAVHHSDGSDNSVEKYGNNIENDVFSMHRYCWCEHETCPWCSEEDAPNFHYKPTDLKVWWYKYIGRGMRTNREVSIEECARMFLDCVNAAQPEQAPSP